MPVTTNKLRRLVKTKHPYLEHNLDSVVTVIRHSIQNAAAFEAAAQQLKEGNATTVSSIFNNSHSGVIGQSIAVLGFTSIYL
jgi:exosome complex exonuclease RRP6